MRFTKIMVASFLAMILASNMIAGGKVYHLKLATSWKKTVPILGEAPFELKKMVETMSNGRLKLRVDDPTKHKAGLAVMDLVKAKQYDIGYTASYYYKGKDFKLIFFTTVPFGLLPAEQHAWFEYGGGKELAKKVYDKHGLMHFQGGNTGMQMGGWFRKEIKSLEDLKGLKVRIPGMGGEVMSKLGVLAVTVPLGELYTSLDRGTIDAVEWISPVYDMNMGFQKIAKYYYTGWQEPASETQFLVNKKSYAKLPKDLQLILETAMSKVANRVLEKSVYRNALAWEKIKTEHPDVKVSTFPKEVLAALSKANDEILNEQAAKDPVFKELLDSQRAFIGKARAWTKMGDYSYINNTSK
ncbi:TRAP transporter substrate-binding protein [Sulfurospirillum arcachonense]|uniref:TRAP transporter substrate-binding protein n=1 Tax=Sulfurospirillum arcachonense TaxID=57666 RepID=UPI000469E29A|nr:TRAP transporter substrate-binding protein DctP [Sulfurospirillum arcachonense]